jgi:hypothetical protein
MQTRTKKTFEISDAVWLQKETVNFLDQLAREVREGKNVMLASQFGRWLNFSGVIKVLEAFPSSRPYLEVDAVVVQDKLNDLLFDCGELFRGGKFDPKYAASDIAEINRKLDEILKRSGNSGQAKAPVESSTETSPVGRTITTTYPVGESYKRNGMAAPLTRA